MQDVDVVWKEAQIFEGWGTLDDGASMFCHRNVAENNARLSDEVMTPLFSIKGKSWNEVMAVYHEVQGWEPYVPMRE